MYVNIGNSVEIGYSNVAKSSRNESDRIRFELKKKKEEEKEEERKIKRIASFDEFVEFRVSIFEISTNSPDGMETTIRKGWLISDRIATRFAEQFMVSEIPNVENR